MSKRIYQPKQAYQVVINHEEQYSILPINENIPRGWKAVGKEGTREQLLDYIEEVWTDMRPLNVRNKVEELRRRLERK